MRLSRRLGSQLKPKTFENGTGASGPSPITISTGFTNEMGIEYGAEIKNTLPYIEKKLLLRKLDIAKIFNVRPFFIVRRAPQNYIEMVRKRGGFTLILDYQLYPFGFRTIAKKIQAELGLPKSVQLTASGPEPFEGSPRQRGRPK